jgi:fatty acid desaturase
MIAHWVIWTIIPIFIFGFANVAIFFMVQMFIMSYIMYALFAPAHYPAEAIQISREAMRDDYLMLQTATAVNFTTGPVGRLLCGGVEYQIEHHLFPWVSTTRYPELSVLVKKFCDDHGYPYRSQSWARGLWTAYLTLWSPKPIYNEFPEISPSRAAQAEGQTSGAMGDLRRA